MSCRLHPHYRIENSDRGVSHIYQPGVNSRIIVVLACPGENEKALGFPAAGETGARLCRIFEKMREFGDGKYEDVCLRNVRIVNASVNVYDSSSQIRKVDVILNPFLKSALIKTQGTQRRLILLLGQHAIWAYCWIARKYKISGDSVVRFCHIGQNGLGHIKGLNKSKLLDRIASYFVESDCKAGEYGWEEFVKMTKLRWSGKKTAEWMRKGILEIGLWPFDSDEN